MAYLYLYALGQKLSAEAPRQLWRMSIEVLTSMPERKRHHFDNERDMCVHGQHSWMIPSLQRAHLRLVGEAKSVVSGYVIIQ